MQTDQTNSTSAESGGRSHNLPAFSPPPLPLHGLDPALRRCMAVARSTMVQKTPLSFASEEAEALEAGSILDRVGIDRINADIAGRMQEIAPRLFLGSEKASSDFALLESAGVRLIVCVMAEGRPPPRFAERGISYRVISVEDDPTENLVAHFPSSSSAIAGALATGASVLVHCRAGASRSAAVITAFIMSACGMRAGEALQLVQAGRCVANPNFGFRKQLIEWEEHLYGDDSTISDAE